MNVYQYTGYREILREALKDRKAKYGRAYTFEKMAGACRIQRTYLSTVLGGEGHLSTDQVFDASEFLGLTDDEYGYLAAVHEHERSVSPERRKRLAREIERRRGRGLTTETYVKAPVVATGETPALTQFYLDVNAILLHMFLTIGRYRSDPQQAARELGLDTASFRAALQRLERVGLVRSGAKGLEVVQESLHLPATSPLYPAYRTAMRLAAATRMQTRTSASHYSFSALYSAADGTRHKVQTRFLEFVDWAQTLTQETPPEHVFQMNFDLLRWTD